MPGAFQPGERGLGAKEVALDIEIEHLIVEFFGRVVD
jgi:hypothetical protein